MHNLLRLKVLNHNQGKIYSIEQIPYDVTEVSIVTIHEILLLLTPNIVFKFDFVNTCNMEIPTIIDTITFLLDHIHFCQPQNYFQSLM